MKVVVQLLAVSVERCRCETNKQRQQEEEGESPLHLRAALYSLEFTDKKSGNVDLYINLCIFYQIWNGVELVLTQLLVYEFHVIAYSVACHTMGTK